MKRILAELFSMARRTLISGNDYLTNKVKANAWELYAYVGVAVATFVASIGLAFFVDNNKKCEQALSHPKIPIKVHYKCKFIGGVPENVEPDRHAQSIIDELTSPCALQYIERFHISIDFLRTYPKIFDALKIFASKPNIVTKLAFIHSGDAEECHINYIVDVLDLFKKNTQIDLHLYKSSYNSDSLMPLGNRIATLSANKIVLFMNVDTAVKIMKYISCNTTIEILDVALNTPNQTNINEFTKLLGINETIKTLRFRLSGDISCGKMVEQTFYKNLQSNFTVTTFFGSVDTSVGYDETYEYIDISEITNRNKEMLERIDIKSARHI